MEDWQISHIRKNLPELVRRTNPDVLLLTKLMADGVLCEADFHVIVSTRHPNRRAVLLYDILDSRKSAYIKLVKALIQTKQNDAANVLLQIPTEKLKKLKILFLGSPQNLESLLNPDQINDMESWLQKNLSTEQLFQIHDNFLNDDTPINLLLDTIPPSSQFYVSRLFDRTELKVGSISEDELVETFVTTSVKGVCICDSSGIGKSLLLASISRKFRNRFPDRIVAFIRLHNLELQQSQNQESPKHMMIYSTLLKHLTTSTLTQCIVAEILKSNDVKFELFFDGLDEVPEIFLESKITFLQNIADRMPKARIFVTSSKMLLDKLENVVGLSSYVIQPFSEESQRSLITKRWELNEPSKDKEKLNEFAEMCLFRVKSLLSQKETKIVGMPLLCSLIASAYDVEANIYSYKHFKTSVKFMENFATTLSEIYTKFMASRFEKAKCKFKCMYLEMDEFRCDEACNLKNFHTLKALELIFPKLAKKLSVPSTRFENLSLDKILSTGLLEESHCITKFEFVHRTYAEYLVAEYMFGILERRQESNENGDLLSQYEQSAFNELLISSKTTDVACPYIFREDVVAYFLDGFLRKTPAEKLSCTSCLPSASHKFLSALQACLHGNYMALFDLIIQATKNLKKSDLEYHRKFLQVYSEITVSIFESAVIYCNAETIQMLLEYFQMAFDIDLFRLWIKKPQDKEDLCRGRHQIIPLLVEKVSLENHGLLYFCIENTYGEDENLVVNKIRTANDLLGYCENLLTEAWEQYDSPLFSNRLHLIAIEFLVKKGIDIWISNESKQTIFHLASNYMSNEDFLELCEFAYVKCKTSERFPKVLSLKGFLQNFDFSSVNSKHYTVLGILRLIEPMVLASNELVNEDLSNFKLREAEKTMIELKHFIKTALGANHHKNLVDLFHITVKKGFLEVANLLLIMDSLLIEKQYKLNQTPILLAASKARTEMVEFLARREANLFAVNSFDETILHVAAKSRNCELFRRIVCLFGWYWDSPPTAQASSINAYNLRKQKVLTLFNYTENECEKTPLHYAVQFLSMPLETLDLFLACGMGQKSSKNPTNVNINATDVQGKTPLHYAVQETRHIEFLKRLVEHGANWEVKTGFGCNIVHLCAQSNLTEHLRYFVDLGCDVNEIDNEGNNALQCAFNYLYEWEPKPGLAEALNVLIKAGVNIGHRNKHGETAYDIALKRKFPLEILKYL